MLKEGIMITIDYTARISNEEDQPVFDTTIEEIARKESIFNEDKIYEPMLVVLGQGWVPIGLEKALLNAKIGDHLNIHVVCDEAYGPKDPSKIKLVARREFQKLDINPSPGDRIAIGNQIGTVVSVTPGRVRMDYNHILSGKDIEYEVNVHKIINTEEDKIQALIKRRLPGANLDKLKIEINDKSIIVHIPEEARYIEYVQFAKKEIANDIGIIIGGYKEIEYREKFSIK